MIESRNALSVYYVLPGELTFDDCCREPGWYFISRPAVFDGPYEFEREAIEAGKLHTAARMYREANNPQKEP